MSSICAAAKFSSRCSIEDVPGIGSITGERASSHASAICAGVASCSRAIRSSGPPDSASLPVASGNQGMKPIRASSHAWSTSSQWRSVRL